MNKKLYIFPGFKETTKQKPYQKLKVFAEAKGYEVVLKNINWKKKFSEQFFPVEKNSILFGFSLGAIFARLLAQDYICNKLLLASMTELSYFKNKNKMKSLIDVCGEEFVKDIAKIIKRNHKAKKEIIFYGELEKTKGDVIVLGVGHRLTDNYLKEINKFL